MTLKSCWPSNQGQAELDLASRVCSNKHQPVYNLRILDHWASGGPRDVAFSAIDCKPDIPQPAKRVQ